jgi:hypothetical protein
VITLPAGVGFDVPVDPDAPVAQRWLVDELSRPVYQTAKPTLFDTVAKAISDWLDSLQVGTVQGPPALAIGFVITLVVIGLVVAFLVFGLPRLNRSSAVAGSLFGEDDARDAALIREAAETAARAGDYSTAVIEMFRSIARGLAERTIVSTTPGTTAKDFAARAGVAFPALATHLVDSSTAFDDVRYLGRDGTAGQYGSIAALERDLRSARPLLDTTAPARATS